jgi:c-di-GMP-binding flagellar brake protein YcgR
VSIKEKRKFARLNIPVMVAYRALDPKESKLEKTKSFTQDISLGGVRIMISDPLPLKTPIELEIHLSENSPPLLVRGDIVWQYYSKIAGQDCYETGIEFTQIDFKDREKIKEAMFDAVKDILKNLDRLYIERR